MQSVEERKAKKHAYYLRNRAKLIANNSKNTRRYVAERYEYTKRVKDVPCTDCKVKYPHYVMEFDHVRGVKKDVVSDLVIRGVSLKRIQEEIAKCDIVCSNCHRERTFGKGKIDRFLHDGYKWNRNKDTLEYWG